MKGHQEVCPEVDLRPVHLLMPAAEEGQLDADGAQVA
jgi:hypothetical protein